MAGNRNPGTADTATYAGSHSSSTGLRTCFPRIMVDGGLLQRLDTRYQTDPNKFSSLFMIVEDEVARQDHIHSKSCTKGLLWLKRSV